MNTQRQKKSVLSDGSRVCIVGGGPAGALFAVHLLREAKCAGRRLSVTIIEKKAQRHPAGRIWQRRGCNHCAGGISPRLHALLREKDLALPEVLIQESFTHIWIHGLWKNFPL
ncbi:MAG: FAD/NAD(P)-binding protein, partial [Desulfococcus multivorans]|nr:FAD/NAD(P)-binding protein [Desulfococcus multivorans]